MKSSSENKKHKTEQIKSVKIDLGKVNDDQGKSVRDKSLKGNSIKGIKKLPESKQKLPANPKILIRPAKADDSEFCAKLLFASFPRFSQMTIGLGKEERTKKILSDLIKKPKHRYSIENILIVEDREKRIKVGLAVTIIGKFIGRENRRFFRRLTKYYPIKGKVALLRRLLPLAFIKEASGQEILISNLSILPKFQGQGFGKALVKHIEKQARSQSLVGSATVFEIQNTHARKFFEKLGYKVKSVVLESNKRVKYFGSGYQRLVKKFRL